MTGEENSGLAAKYWRLTRGYRKSLAIGAAAHLGVNALQLVPPAALGMMLDSASGGKVSWPPAAIAATYIGVHVVQAALRYPLRMGFVGTACRIGVGIREDFGRHLLGLRTSEVSARPAGDLLTRATSDLGSVEGALSTGIPFLLDCFLYLLTIPAVMIWLSPSLTAWAFLALLPLPVVAAALVSRVSGNTREAQESLGRLASRAHENAVAMQAVRAYGLGAREAEAFEAAGRDYAERDLSRSRLEAVFAGAVQFLIAASLFTVLSLGGRQVVERHLSLGRFVTFLQYAGMLAWPLTGFAWSVLLFRKGAGGLERIREVLSLPIQATSDRGRSPSSRGALEIRNLTYFYPGSRAPALLDLSFSVAPGERVALLGPLGSGKSTLLKMLARIIEPPPGTVFVDGVDVITLDLGDLRGRVAFVPQDPFLFSGTVRENIAVGSGDPAEILEAAGAAQLEGAEFSGGLETPVGAKGAGLSGGQRQRVTIARALARKAPILVLDDATSALDSETEGSIIRRLGRGTVVWATHRASFAGQADRIVALDAGRLVEWGTPKELVSTGGLFSTALTSQSPIHAFDSL